GFLQATEAGQGALQAAAMDIVGDAARVADLFAGAGCFALMMAAKAEVLAVEGEQALLSALQAGWRSTEGLKAIEVQRRDLFRRPLLVEELAPFDAVVIDPPRAGARAQMETLAKSSVPVIASISCDAVSFARDTRILIDGGYSLDWVQPVDQFRWSPHVEIAARFAR
ncbi:MAG: RsmD family RNA methyltransferase, partial [Pseudomonadota bacterium]